MLNKQLNKMDRRVEFFGPGCAGKTYLYRQLTSRLKKGGFPVVSESDLRRIYISHRLKSPILKAIFRSAALYSPHIKRAIDGTILPSATGLVERSRWAEIADLIMFSREKGNVFHSDDLSRMLMFIKTISDIVAFEDIGWNGVLVQDESMIQRIQSISLFDLHGEDKLRTYIQALPLPDVVIYVTAPKEDIYKRARERSGSHSSNYQNPQYLDEIFTLDNKIANLIDEKTRLIRVFGSSFDIGEIVETVKTTCEA